MTGNRTQLERMYGIECYSSSSVWPMQRPHGSFIFQLRGGQNTGRTDEDGAFNSLGSMLNEQLSFSASTPKAPRRAPFPSPFPLPLLPCSSFHIPDMLATTVWLFHAPTRRPAPDSAVDRIRAHSFGMGMMRYRARSFGRGSRVWEQTPSLSAAATGPSM